MENIKVDKVIICKQGKDSFNFEKFKKIVKEKRIKVIVLKKRRRIENRAGRKNTNFMANRKSN